MKYKDKIQILPAIDMINGKCVRLTKGDYETKIIYSDDPVLMAKSFEEAGADYIHLVDLDAAKSQGDNFTSIEAIAKTTSLTIQMGGGIRSESALQKAFDSGVKRCILGSISVSNPNLVYEWISKYGADRIVIGADTKDGFIATHGWYETSSLAIDEFIGNYSKNGASIFLCTEISKDGMLQGIASDLYYKLQLSHPTAKLIASGGVASIDDVNSAIEIGMFGVIIGKAIYEGKISLDQLFER
jgi:phosphoribosylformimino-5-aminoimidazole carboxamide ribotide isomerase